MSIDKCKCGEFVDTDEDCGAYSVTPEECEAMYLIARLSDNINRLTRIKI